MKHTFALLTALLLAPLAALHAAYTSPPLVKTGVILVNHVGFPPNAAKHCVIPAPPKKELTAPRRVTRGSGVKKQFPSVEGWL